MTILRSISRILILLISFFIISCEKKGNFEEKNYNFKSPFSNQKTYPVYPEAEPDYSYARAGVYVFSFIYGWDPKNRTIFAYSTSDPLEDVKKFYENILSTQINCEIIDHSEFVKKHWDLFQEFEFPNLEGYYQHCRGPSFDILSPYYHYGKLSWESGTMIVFIK